MGVMNPLYRASHSICELHEGTKARSKPLLLDSEVSVVIKVLDKALVNEE